MLILVIASFKRLPYVGDAGRHSDGRVLSNSAFGKVLLKKDWILPKIVHYQVHLWYAVKMKSTKVQTLGADHAIEHHADKLMAKTCATMLNRLPFTLEIILHSIVTFLFDYFRKKKECTAGIWTRDLWLTIKLGKKREGMHCWDSNKGPLTYIYMYLRENWKKKKKQYIARIWTRDLWVAGTLL